MVSSTREIHDGGDRLSGAIAMGTNRWTIRATIFTPEMMVENPTCHMHADAVMGRVIVPLRVFPDIETLG